MKNLLLFLILVIKSAKQIKHPNMIQVFTFKQYPDNKITVYIGDQPIQVKTTIDLMNENSCFILNEYTHYGSSVSSIVNPNKQIIHKENITIGKEIEDLFSFEDDNFGPQIKLRFDFIDNDPSLYNLNRISIPFAFKDESYSIIHQMKYKGIINHLSFSRVRLNLVTYFYFGGIPDKYIGNQTTISHCDVIGGNGYWDCLLNEITIRNNNMAYAYTSTPGSVVIFDLEKVFIFAPTNFIDFLINTFFKDYLLNEDCNILENSFRRLSCRIDVSFKMGRMAFAIGDYIYTFDLEQFIKCSIGRCFLEIVENPDGNYWRLGSYFFDTFDVLFDYELKKIFFYSNKGVELNNKRQKNTNKKMIFSVNVMIMICGLWIIFFSKKYLKY